MSREIGKKAKMEVRAGQKGIDGSGDGGDGDADWIEDRELVKWK